MAEIEDVRSIRVHLTQEQLKNVYLFYGPETLSEGSVYPPDPR